MRGDSSESHTGTNNAHGEVPRLNPWHLQVRAEEAPASSVRVIANYCQPEVLLLQPELLPDSMEEDGAMVWLVESRVETLLFPLQAFFS